MGNTPVTLDFSKALPIGQTEDEQKQSKLQQSIAFGASQNPDDYAKRLSLQKQTGIHPEVSDGNVDQVRQAADINSIDYAQMVASHPRTTAWASNPDTAAVSGVDEIHRMAQVENHAAEFRAWNPTFWEKVDLATREARQRLFEYPGTRMAIDMAAGIPEMAGDVAAFFGVNGEGADKRNLLQRIAHEMSPEANVDPERLYAKSNTVDWLAKNISPIIASMGASMGTSLVAKTLGLSTKAAKVLNGLAIGGMFGASQAGRTYTDLVNAGMSDYEARYKSLQVAAINAPANALFGATELIPLLRNNPLAASLILGGATGVSGQVGENVVTGQWPKGWLAKAEQLGGAGLQGAALMGGMHLGNEMFMAKIAEMGAAIDASKLKERAPEILDEGLRKIFEGDASMRIPAEQFETYFQSKGMDPATVAAQLGSTNYAEAKLSGGDVEVSPASFFGKLDPEHRQALAEDIVNPATGQTTRQYKEGQQELEQWLANGGAEKLQAEAQKVDSESQAHPDFAPIRDEISTRLQQGMNLPKAQADAIAVPFAMQYMNAERAGMSPMEYFKARNPVVKSGDAPDIPKVEMPPDAPPEKVAEAQVNVTDVATKVAPEAAVGVVRDVESGDTVFNVADAARGLAEGKTAEGTDVLHQGVESPVNGRFLRGTNKTAEPAPDVVSTHLIDSGIQLRDYDQFSSVEEARQWADNVEYLDPIVREFKQQLRYDQNPEGYYGNDKMAFPSKAYPNGRNTWDVPGCGREAWAVSNGLNLKSSCYGGACYAEALKIGKQGKSAGVTKGINKISAKAEDRAALIDVLNEKGFEAAQKEGRKKNVEVVKIRISAKDYEAQKAKGTVWEEDGKYYKASFGIYKRADGSVMKLRDVAAGAGIPAVVSTDLAPAKGQDIRLGVDTDGAAWLSNSDVMDAIMKTGLRSLSVYSSGYHNPPPPHPLSGRTIINVTISGWHPLAETMSRLRWAEEARANGWNVILREVVADPEVFGEETAKTYNRLHDALLKTDFFIMQQSLHVGSKTGRGELFGLPGCCKGSRKNPHTCDQCEVSEGLGKRFQEYWGLANENTREEKVLPDVPTYKGNRLVTLHQSALREPATFNGKPFFTGAVNPLDGQIEAVVDHRQAASFRHRGYFPPELADRIDRGELATFVVHDGRVSLHRTANEGMPEAGLLKAIESQIQVMPQTLYQPKQETPEGAPELRTDNPGGYWLKAKQLDQRSGGKNEWGVYNRGGATTGFFREPAMVPVDILADIPGARGEQGNVRQETLQGLTENFRKTGRLPQYESGGKMKDYSPFVLVDQDGKPWMFEGNHRVMAAKAAGIKYLPTEIKYENGGEQANGVMHPDKVLEYHNEATSKGFTREDYSGRNAQSDTTPLPSTDGAMHQGADNPRGWFRILPDGSFEIGKTPFGDKSTPVHEGLGHPAYYLLRDLASREGASEQLKADLATVHDWLGVKDGIDPNREQMERWARAVELYFTKGEAPTSGLRKVFQRIAVWMSSVYKAAKQQLGVEIPPQISDVMDRWFAASDVVDKVAKERIDSVDQTGWTPEQVQKYAEAKGMEVEEAKAEILAKLNEAALRERTDYWREEEKNVRETVTQEIDSKPEYAAIRALRKGELDNGDTIAINREALVKQFGEERVKELQKQHPGLYRNEGGLNPEVAAEILGFESAGKMMDSLESAPRRSAAIEQATRDYMTAKHGDIRYDGSLEDQARIALENDKRAANLHKELQELRKKVERLTEVARGEAVAPLEVYRTAARQMVETKSVRDLTPSRYLDASRKYGREAFDALRKGDVEEAVQAKHKELLNHFLFREATNAREYVGKVEGLAEKIASPKRQGDIGKGGQDFLSQVQGLLTKYQFVDLFKHPAVAQTESLGDFLTRMREQGQDMPIAPNVIDGAGKHYKDLAVSELRDVHAALAMLDHVARDINKITIEGRKVEEAKVAAGLDQALVDNVKGGERNAGARVTDDARSLLARVKDSVGTLPVSVLRPEFLFKRLDGLKDFGIWHDAFWNKYNDAADHLTRLRESIFPQMLEIARGKWAKSLEERIYIKSIDATLSKNDIFSILLNCGNESNMDKLERGGLRFKVDGNAIPLTEDVRQELFKHLTSDDIDQANKILKLISTLKPEVEKLSLKRNGVAPQWIETRPYQTANGTLEGGYFPLVYDPRWSSAGEKQADANTVDQMFNKYAQATTRQGYTKERTEGFAAPLSLDWQSVVIRHLDNVMIDISHWQFVTDAQRLLKNPVVKESIISNLGEAYHKNLMDWVRYTVNQDVMGREATDRIDRWRRIARNNIGTAVLGFRVMNSVVETAITPLLALQQAPPEMVFKGMMAYMRNPVEAHRFAAEASDYMKNLNVEYDRQITEMWNDLRGQHSLVADIRKWSILARTSIWNIGTTMAWHIGYLDAQRQGLDGKAAVRVADALNRKIQEAGRPGDLSSTERNPYMKELTMFIGPTLIQFNNYMESAHAFADRGFNAQTAGKALTVLLAGHLVNSVLFEIMRRKGPEDEKKWPAWLVARMTLGLFDGVPLINQATRYAEGLISDEKGQEPRLTPAVQLTKDIPDSVKATLEATQTGKWSKAVSADARTVGSLTGLPMTQTTITGKYLYDLFSGNYKPENPWSYVTDAFYSRKPKH